MSPKRRWIETLARVGFAVKGLLYLVLGGLALRFALGDGGRLTDAHGAIATLLRTEYGRPLVGSVAVGLAFYAVWRFIEAFADANGKGTGAGGIASRAVYALSGCIYGLLAVDGMILSLAVGANGSGGAELPPTLLGSELAHWGAILVGLGLGGYGIAQLGRSLSSTLSDRLSLRRVERSAGPWPIRISRVGIAGRAVVLVLMGVVLVRRAATSTDAAAQTNSGDSLRLLAALPAGDWLLMLVAAGVIAYGVFQLVQARYRVITPP